MDDVVVLTGLPVFGDSKAIRMSEDSNDVFLDVEGERGLGLLVEALSESKYTNKSTYTT